MLYVSRCSKAKQTHTDFLDSIGAITTFINYHDLNPLGAITAFRNYHDLNPLGAITAFKTGIPVITPI